MQIDRLEVHFSPNDNGILAGSVYLSREARFLTAQSSSQSPYSGLVLWFESEPAWMAPSIHRHLLLLQDGTTYPEQPALDWLGSFAIIEMGPHHGRIEQSMVHLYEDHSHYYGKAG